MKLLYLILSNCYDCSGTIIVLYLPLEGYFQYLRTLLVEKLFQIHFLHLERQATMAAATRHQIW